MEVGLCVPPSTPVRALTLDGDAGKDLNARVKDEVTRAELDALPGREATSRRERLTSRKLK
jgi:hypothetical protein